MDNQLPPEAHDDCYRPPSIPTEVWCLHCQQCYESYLIEWRESTLPDGRCRGFWCCPMPGCDGAGFGFDIHPTDPNYIDPDGRDMGEWVDDDEEDADEEAWYDDECIDDEDDELDDALIEPPPLVLDDANTLKPRNRIGGYFDDEVDDIPF